MAVRPEVMESINNFYKQNPEEAAKEFGDNPYELKNILKYWVRSPKEGLQLIPTDSIVIKLDKEAVKRSGMMIPDLTVISCGNSNKKSDRIDAVEKEVVKAPEFNADSAYAYVGAQADFGPRVPNTKAHEECGEYLAQQLEKFGAKVYNQRADLIAWDGTILKARNIIGAYKPESKKRIMLCAHWDSRPYADNDPDPKNHHTHILGVNDGASGVGVLLEIARQIQQKEPALGIDIIFFDAEDYGTPEFYTGQPKQDTCLTLYH